MSHEPVATEVSAPSRADATSTPAGQAALHERLQGQLGEASAGGVLNLRQLFELISAHYEHVDAERRGIVRSMQMIADEARSFGAGLSGADAGHLRAILDHIKDVVMTVGADGTIKIFSPPGERVFGYAPAEVIGRSVVHLLPDLPREGLVERGLAELATQMAQDRFDLRPPELSARHRDGHRFPVELVASRVRIEQRDVYVLCLRDISERVRAEQALRDSEARYRTLVECAPEMIVMLERRNRRYVDANDSALRFLGLTRASLADGASAPEHSARAVQLAADLGARAATDEIQVFEWLHRDEGGQEAELEVRLMRLPGAPDQLRASLTDIAARRRAEKLTSGERDIFERIAADVPLPEVLASIALLLESLDAGFTVSIGRLDAQAHSFIEIIGPRLPARWREMEQGLPVDMRNGSGHAAVYLGRQVIVSDVGRDPFWQRRRELALELGFLAAWAVPIKVSKGRMLGSVTVYRSTPCAPQPHELQTLVHAAHLAAIAIERHNAETALRASEVKFRNLYEGVLDGIYQCDLEGHLLEVNPAFVKMLGYHSAAQLGALPSIAALYRDPAQRTELERTLQSRGVVHNAEVVLNCRDGGSVVALESARLSSDSEGRVIGYEGTLADISARKQAEQAMFAEKERALVTLQSIGDAVITTDGAGLIDYMNPVAERLTGWQSGAARGERIGNVMRLLDESSEGEMDHALARCLRDGQVVQLAEHGMINRQGQEIAIQDSGAPIRDRAGQIVGAVVVFRDVTKERRLRRALSYQASHDALTGLINRRELDNRLADALRSAHEHRGPHALLYMDLDEFKLVNDACGHSAGDRLLRDITGLLQAQVRAGDTIARLGGDEFGVLMPRCNAQHAVKVAETIRRSVQEYRFNWDQHTSHIGVSIGVVEITAESQNVATLLSAADIACYAAKDAGRNRVHLYDARHDAARQHDLVWVGRVTRGLEQGRLELFCQAVVPTGTSRRVHPPLYELLARLRDDDGELLLPRQFIPAAERYNVVSAIDRWVLQSAIQVLRELSPDLAGQVGQGACSQEGSSEAPGGAGAAGKAPLAAPRCVLALNLSGASLGDRSFLEFVLSQLTEPQTASALCFEVSEAAVLRNMSEALEFMRELRQRGCRFALADVGSDLSSFRYLKTLPIDYLKLTGECIGGVITDPVDRCMVEAISRAARALGIVTVAEKVESAAVFAELQRLGVELAQGLFVAAPEPIELLLAHGPAAGMHSAPPTPHAVGLPTSYRAVASARSGQHS